MRLKRLLLAGLTTLALCVAPGAAAAAPGAPGAVDRSFGRGGLATLRDPYLSFLPTFLAEQADGGILVGAAASVPGSSAGPGFALARFDRRGRRDMAFGRRGRLDTGLSSAAAVTLPGGGFFVAGVTGTDVAAEAGVMRYTDTGLPAPGFDEGSKLITAVNSLYLQPFAVAADGQGRMLVAPSNGSVYRLTADGALDPSFGTGGRATPSLSSQSITIDAIAVQPDGRIVVAGERRGARGSAEVLIARLMTDGSADASFGGPGAGRVIEDNTSDWREARALALGPAGTIFATGDSFGLVGAAAPRLPLWRFPANGASGGIQFVPGVAGLSHGQGLAVDRAGNLLLLDLGSVPLQNPPRLFRLHPDATVDRGFGRAGRVTWGRFFPAGGPLLLRDGRIVVALGEQLGKQTDPDVEGPADVAVIRLTRLWGGYDKAAPRIGLRLSCRGRQAVARIRIRDRSRIGRLDVWIAGHRHRLAARSRARLVLHRAGALRVVAVDQAGNRAKRTVRVRSCGVSG